MTPEPTGPPFKKQDVDYSKGKEKSHCGNCVHFTEGKDPFGDAKCDIVIGPVRWMMWCEKWQKK